MNLHDIKTEITAWAWGQWVGGNGRAIGQGGYAHLVPVERGTPPPIVPEGTVAHRFYWRPYPPPNPDLHDALCGGPTTQANRRRIWFTDTPWRGRGNCPSCAAIAMERGIPARSFYDLRFGDPWNQIDRAARWNTPDPVTGL